MRGEGDGRQHVIRFMNGPGEEEIEEGEEKEQEEKEELDECEKKIEE